MSNETIRPRSHEDWLSVRKQGIGSSEIGTILGINPFETPYQLWLRKTGRDTSVKEENFAMKAGHYLEDAVSRFFSDETGAVIQKNSACDFIVRSKEKPFLQVSPDRFFKLNDKRKRILECKTTQREIDVDDIPKHWFVQLQYQLGVCELEAGALAWLTQGREFGFKEYQFDPDIFKFIIDSVEEFWCKNVLEGIEPNPISVDDVKLKYSTSTDTTLKADANLLEQYYRLKQLKEEEKLRSAEIDKLEDAIKIKMAGNERIETEVGELLVSWKSSAPRKTFDTERFKSEHPEEYQKYVKEGASARRFKLY